MNDTVKTLAVIGGLIALARALFDVGVAIWQIMN